MWCSSGPITINQNSVVKWPSGLLPAVLAGEDPTDKLNKMSVTKLENLITQLVQVYWQANGKVDDSKCMLRPQWWPQDLKFGKPICLLRNEGSSFSVKWSAILRDVISRCSKFYKERPQRMFLGVGSTPRRALAPKHSNINTATSKRKKDVSSLSCMPLKKIRIDPKLYSSRTKTEVNSAKSKLNNNNVHISDNEQKSETKSNKSVAGPVVKLVDILKFKTAVDVETKSLDKDGFLNYLKLNNKQKIRKQLIPQYATRLQRLPSHIPFSSEVGQLYLKRENHCNPVESQEKKLDRLEWYLKEPPLAKEREYEVSFNEKFQSDATHVYNFPKRQFWQRQVKIDKLLQMCRPLSIPLENFFNCKVVIRSNLTVTKTDDQLTYSYKE